MKIISEVTFKKVCIGYFFISVMISLLIPSGISIEGYLPLPVEYIPFANYVVTVPGHLNSVSLYFLIMWTLFPLIFTILALRPQKIPAETVPSSPAKLVFATLVAFTIFAVVCKAAYLDISNFEPSSRGIALLLLMAQYKMGLGTIGGVFMLTSVLAAHMALFLVPKLWYSYSTSTR